MAALASTDAAPASAPPKTTAELDFLFDREGIAPETQKKVRDAGVLTVRHFAGLAATSDGMREILTKDLEVDTSTFAGKVAASKFLAAWESAKARSSKVAQVEAEAEIRQDAKPIITSDYKAMREAYEAAWWPLARLLAA